MTDILEALEEANLVAEARRRYQETESYQGRLKTKYQRLHHFYAPINGDQWPEDLVQRPGKLHLTANMFKAAVDVDSRLQSLPPRISLVPDGPDEESHRRAEGAEKLMIRFLEISGWDVWFGDFTRSKCLYGKGVLKPFYNAEEQRPDVRLVENPANLRIGWGASDFSAMDWALYEYALSPFEAMRRWPQLQIVNMKKGDGHPLIVQKWGTHTDPLDQMQPIAAGMEPTTQSKILSRPIPYISSEYEGKQVRVWDYWYKHDNGDVCNVILVEGVIAQGPDVHAEYADIPYIIVENDHEPGSPEGISTGEPLIDLQIEFNRAISHWAQLVADEIDPAWQLNGENADSVPDGIVPRGGEIIAAGAGNEINPIAKSVNQFPIQQLMDEYWKQFHRISGLPEILFGNSPGSEVSGRALAVQVEAAANRLDPKRRRAYAGLRELLIFWTYMLEKQNPKVPVVDKETGESQQMGVGDAVRGFRRWKIVAPEITPRDVIENTTNVVNKVNGKLISLRTGMDELGVDSPEEEIDLIRLERSDIKLFPGDVNAQVAVEAALQQIWITMQQMQTTMQQMQGQAQDQLAAQNEGAQPAGTQGDNGASPAQPATMEGGASPAGGAGVQGTTLVRAQPNGGAQTLNQLAMTRKY